MDGRHVHDLGLKGMFLVMVAISLSDVLLMDVE